MIVKVNVSSPATYGPGPPALIFPCRLPPPGNHPGRWGWISQFGHDPFASDVALGSGGAIPPRISGTYIVFGAHDRNVVVSWLDPAPYANTIHASELALSRCLQHFLPGCSLARNRGTTPGKDAFFACPGSGDSDSSYV